MSTDMEAMRNFAGKYKLWIIDQSDNVRIFSLTSLFNHEELIPKLIIFDNQGNQLTENQFKDGHQEMSDDEFQNMLNDWPDEFCNPKFKHMSKVKDPEDLVKLKWNFYKTKKEQQRKLANKKHH